MEDNKNSSSISTTYDPALVERESYQAWIDARIFHAEPTGDNPAYSIVIPPPNVTGYLHMGHQ